MISLLFSKGQNELFNKQFEYNLEEIKIWNVINVILPCVIILIPSFFFSFLPDDKVTFQNLILNGSFSLLGINILFSMSIFLITSKRLEDGKFEAQIIQLRIRLIIYLCGFLIIGTITYLLQIAFSINSFSQILTTSIGFILILYFSVGIGKRIYLLKDELVGKPYSEDISDSVSKLKESTNDLN
jgi:hypothetical protein